MSEAMKRVLIVVAHPDDEVLMSGGLIQRVLAQGGEVFVLVLCENGTVRYGNAEQNLTSMRECAKVLRVWPNVKCAMLPDQGMDTTPLMDVIHKITERLWFFKPDTVVTHWRGDLNRDHRIVNEAVMVATRPKAGMPVMEVWEGFAPSTSEWFFGESFKPTVYVQLSEAQADRKLEAFSKYEHEQAEDTPRSMGNLKDYMKTWGSTVGVPYAEIYQQVRRTW